MLRCSFVVKEALSPNMKIFGKKGRKVFDLGIFYHFLTFIEVVCNFFKKGYPEIRKLLFLLSILIIFYF